MASKLMRLFPRSKFGLILGILYLALAIGVAYSERYGGPSSGFISMQGLGVSVVTFPGAFLVSTCFPGLGFDELGFFDTPYSWKTIFSISLAITLCTLLVYLMGAAMGAFVKTLLGKDSE